MKKFKKIYIEITNRCNLACSFCPRSERKKSFMRPEEFRAILGAIEGYTDHLALHVLGEPLLHPELGVLLALCQEHSLKVNLTTNGTLLPQRQELLLASPALRQVNISLHSFSEHDGDPTISGYLPEILSFIREAEATGLLISLRLWNLPPTGTSLPSPNETILKTLEYFFGLSEPLVARLTPGHGITLAPKVFLSQNNRFTWPHGPAPDLGDKGTCRGLKDHVAILVDGTVAPCCLDGEADIPLGNIHAQSLAGILASPRAVAMRTGFSQWRLTEPLCRRCTFRQSF
ncbi:MAG: radical SAM protein [Proteobacteria bacterium]|nr:radical SAM protein [Pseudomonadota bacterium]MBU1547823.1 radical SAM protein [Pseudomonadota bacterium]MBU2618756.1 radical SAM protein [Pseudomonadota bacterium]